MYVFIFDMGYRSLMYSGGKVTLGRVGKREVSVNSYDKNFHVQLGLPQGVFIKKHVLNPF